MRSRLSGLPYLLIFAAAAAIPLAGDDYILSFVQLGKPPVAVGDQPSAAYYVATPGYFGALRIPVTRGRDFTEHDDAAAPPVIIISESMARQFYPNENPLGQRIQIGNGSKPAEIVGIVGDVRQGLDQPPNPIMYVPIAQVNDGVIALNNRIGAIQWVVRTKLQPFSLSADIQRELREASGGLPVAHIRSMQQVVGESTARNDFNMTLLTIFASVALVLAAIGLYGLMAYSVQQRTQEIGVRMALGANPGQVRRMVVLQGMRLNLIGVILGIVASLALTRLMKSMLFGVTPWDPATIVIVVLLLISVTLLAAYLPARRASRVDPIVALRYE